MTAASASPEFASICALLRGESPIGPDAADDASIAAFLSTARAHGVTPLLDRRFTESHTAAPWPEALRHACHEDALAQAMHELAHRAELGRVLAALTTAGIAPLIMKGTALAYSHYPNPALRPRGDTDVLVAPAKRAIAWNALRELGYFRIAGPAGTYVGYQCALRHEGPHGFIHEVDLHWRINNLQSFAWLFTFEQLDAASVRIPAIAPSARRLGDSHALILALLHRAGNNRLFPHGFGDRLIWLYDLHLLVEAMGDDERSRFRQMVEDAGVVAIAIDGLRSCAEALGTPRAQTLVAELERSPEAKSGAAFLHSGKLALEWLELLAMPTISARLGYLAGRLLPQADYMRERFPDATDRALPVLHARRWAEGVGGRWLTRLR